jgi:hypothetical protein
VSFELPTEHELSKPANEVALLVVRRLFVDRVDRELRFLTQRRRVEAGGRPVAAADRREIVATGNLRAFASLTEGWLRCPDVVEVAADPSPAESGVLAVLHGGLGSGDAEWTPVASTGSRLSDGDSDLADLAPLDRALIGAWLARHQVGADRIERDNQFLAWWQDSEQGGDPPVGPSAEDWLTESGHGPDRWVQEIARALADAYFHEQDPAHGADGWPVRTLRELPFPTAEADPVDAEVALHDMLTTQHEHMTPSDYPGAIELFDRALVRRKQGYVMG